MNFQKLIQDLIDLGMTQVEIKDACQCSQSTISDLLNGKIKNPSFAIGQSLLELHAKRSEKAA
jgi:transcriptional regulator with XRE-family HTH domain